MMSLTFGLFTQVSGSGPLGPLVCGIGTGFSLSAYVLKRVSSLKLVKASTTAFDGSCSKGKNCCINYM